MKVYVSSCDLTSHVLPTFSYLFNKYWDSEMEVIVLGFKKPLFDFPNNFSFFSMGERQVGGASGWSNYIIDYFSKNVKEERFVFVMDDHAIVRPVDKNLYNIFCNLINNDEKIGRIGLTGGIQFGREAKNKNDVCIIDEYKIIEISQYPNRIGQDIYKLTGQWSIWNKDYFLKKMQRNWSPHDWEIIGGKAAEGDGQRIMSSRDSWCIKKIELISIKQWGDVINVYGMLKEDVDYVEKENLLPKEKFSYIYQDTKEYYRTYLGMDE